MDKIFCVLVLGAVCILQAQGQNNPACADLSAAWCNAVTVGGTVCTGALAEQYCRTTCPQNCPPAPPAGVCVDDPAFSSQCQSLSNPANNYCFTCDQTLFDFLNTNCRGSCDNICAGQGISTVCWSDWTNGACTVTCGGGTLVRTRTCMGGTVCPGNAEETISCNEQACPIWSDYSNWSTCSATCGRGMQMRNRTCLNADVALCTGSSVEYRTCVSNVTCPCTCPTVNGNATACTCGTWGEWRTSPCTARCGGGVNIRTRSCPSGTICDGNNYEYVECNTQACETATGGNYGAWTDWTAWGPCSTTCGAGEQVSTRTCPSPPCSGNQIVTLYRQCSLGICSNDYECSRFCGKGSRYYASTWSDCNTATCYNQTCPSYYARRYGKSSSECCYDKSTSTCGVISPALRIVGGTTTGIRYWPWMVQLRYSFSQFCGGTLLSGRYILTAEHCTIGFQPSEVIVRAGADTLSQTNANLQDRTASVISSHPNYTDNVNSLRNDISVIEVSPDFVETDYVKPLCLPKGERIPADAYCVVAGWGDTSEGANAGSNTLRQVEVRILPNEYCMAAYPNGRFDPEIMVCAGKIAGGIDTCQGDSGGPLMCQRCSSCEWFIVGITSFGDGCARPGSPGVYTRVSAYENWLSGIVGNDLALGSETSCPRASAN